jgi:pyruvate formate lyase activating enzyme
MTGWVVANLGPDVPLHFTAFHPDWKLTDKPPTPSDTLLRAREIALKNGVRFAYTGNVYDPAGNSTWCPSCRALLIERDGYRIGHWGLDAHGACRDCGTVIPGVFEPEPGHFGARRIPIRLSQAA